MSRFTFSGIATGFFLALTLVSPSEAQQNPLDPANFLAPGSETPAVSLAGATRWGPLQTAVHLPDLAGKTVVLAFFPAARTRGCTIQMQTYRDEYQRLLNGGRDVVLIAISNDPTEALVSWAYDEDFPFLFGSDPDGTVYRAFGGTPRESGRFDRTLVVLSPEGTVAKVIPQFREVDPTAYDELQDLVRSLSARQAEADDGQR